MGVRQSWNNDFQIVFTQIFHRTHCKRVIKQRLISSMNLLTFAIFVFVAFFLNLNFCFCLHSCGERLQYFVLPKVHSAFGCDVKSVLCNSYEFLLSLDKIRDIHLHSYNCLSIFLLFPNNQQIFNQIVEEKVSVQLSATKLE